MDSAMDCWPLWIFLLAPPFGGIACAGHVRTSSGHLAVEHGSLADAEATYRGAACHSGFFARPDPKHCGPFPCVDEKCEVARCGADEACANGVCADGYCLNAAPAGAKVCERFVDPPRPDAPASRELSEEARAYYASRNGCACAPSDVHSRRDSDACSSFPCLPEGCYAKACSRDEDCRVGLCSGHASGPHGYCVMQDPI
jgi:hypothetical protein